jgi:hypothetical protein
MNFIGAAPTHGSTYEKNHVSVNHQDDGSSQEGSVQDGTFIDLVLSAASCRSPLSSLGHSSGRSAFETCPITYESSSAIADVGADWVRRQQCGELLTVAASSSQTAASCISELTLPTRLSYSRSLQADIQYFVCVDWTDPSRESVNASAIDRTDDCPRPLSIGTQCSGHCPKEPVQ